MRAALIAGLVLGAVLCWVLPSFAQAPRLDTMWARKTTDTITLNGVLSEPAWASAESCTLRYGVDNGIPGSGYKEEGGRLAKDSTFAIIKFLVVDNQLYMGAVVSDSSVGGARDFNRFDGFLMSLKDHSSLGHPKPAAEYFYSWWYPDTCDHDPSAPGKEPGFRGRWGEREDFCAPRTQEQIDNWDAVTIVNGLSNSDAGVDVGYTVEMRFNLTPMGYDVTQAQGDVLEFNLSIYDCDWFWPINLFRFSSNRTWWQSPWGNVAWYHQVQIHARPDVTVGSGPVPIVDVDIRVPNGQSEATPVIDGNLNETVWSIAPGFDIRYGDDALRDGYPGVLKWRGGQFQPEVNGGLAFVFDPGDATVKWFFKGDILYLGFDVRDIAVQHHPIIDRWDGFIVTINDRETRWRDRNLESRRLTFRVGPNGEGLVEDYLPALRDTLQGAEFALALKANTTVDTVGFDEDEGYMAELAIDLTKLGYPAGLGDRVLFIGFDLLDGDSFTPFSLSYATRTWWGREYEHECCPAWAYLDPSLPVDVPRVAAPGRQFDLLGNSPNPFRLTTMISYALDVPSVVTLEVFDIQGRVVATRLLGLQTPGIRRHAFKHQEFAPGLYLYRFKATDPVSGAERTSQTGKMMRVK